MKARIWLVIAAVALWAAVVIATRHEPARVPEILLTAGELAQIERQARVLCARSPAPGYVALPDGVLVCAGEQRQVAAASRSRP